MTQRESVIRRMLGKNVHVVIDRPIGYNHHGLIYPVNYGYIPGVIAGDGEEQDVYILGIGEPIGAFDGIIIGAALRKNDVEDKLIAAPEGMDFSPDEVTRLLHFQEQFFDTTIVLL